MQCQHSNISREHRERERERLVVLTFRKAHILHWAIVHSAAAAMMKMIASHSAVQYEYMLCAAAASSTTNIETDASCRRNVFGLVSDQ